MFAGKKKTMEKIRALEKKKEKTEKAVEGPRSRGSPAARVSEEGDATQDGSA